MTTGTGQEGDTGDLCRDGGGVLPGEAGGAEDSRSTLTSSGSAPSPPPDWPRKHLSNLRQ